MTQYNYRMTKSGLGGKYLSGFLPHPLAYYWSQRSDLLERYHIQEVGAGRDNYEDFIPAEFNLTVPDTYNQFLDSRGALIDLEESTPDESEPTSGGLVVTDCQDDRVVCELDLDREENAKHLIHINTWTDDLTPLLYCGEDVETTWTYDQLEIDEPFDIDKLDVVVTTWNDGRPRPSFIHPRREIISGYEYDGVFHDLSDEIEGLKLKVVDYSVFVDMFCTESLFNRSTKNVWSEVDESESRLVYRIRANTGLETRSLTDPEYSDVA